MRTFGLIGKQLGHSFSAKYFNEKFEKEGIVDANYQLFELADIALLPKLLQSKGDIKGLNVTIPYKTKVMPYLDAIDTSAKRIGAVNTIKFTAEGSVGFNTDVYGFRQSLENWLKELRFYPLFFQKMVVFILGTGGAAKAVAEALRQMNLQYCFVSRAKTNENTIDYTSFATQLSSESPSLIVNTTPLGMYPHEDTFPAVPFDKLSPNILIFDLIYNPHKTILLAQCEAKGCPTKNGMEMLHLQAERAWEIWNT